VYTIYIYENFRLPANFIKGKVFQVFVISCDLFSLLTFCTFASLFHFPFGISQRIFVISDQNTLTDMDITLWQCCLVHENYCCDNYEPWLYSFDTHSLLFTPIRQARRLTGSKARIPNQFGSSKSKLISIDFSSDTHTHRDMI